MSVDLLLSICIATYNRAEFIGETLDSIFSQNSPLLEVVVVDGGSTDNTEEVVRSYLNKEQNLRYRRLKKPSGVDKDFDIAVSEGKGRFCWLLSDDDPLVPGSIGTILESLEKDDIGLLIINAAVYDISLSNRLVASQINISKNVNIEPEKMDDLISQVGNYFTFIGCVIIKKCIWDERVRDRYYGTEFIHIGVIFQDAIKYKMKIIAKPLIRIRLGNAKWSSRAFKIWGIKWPTLIWSFNCLSDGVKLKIADLNIKNKLIFQIIQRAKGSYNISMYKEHVSSTGLKNYFSYLIAMSPVLFLNIFVSLFFSINKKMHILSLYDLNQIRNNILLNKQIT